VENNITITIIKGGQIILPVIAGAITAFYVIRKNSFRLFWKRFKKIEDRLTDHNDLEAYALFTVEVRSFNKDFLFYIDVKKKTIYLWSNDEKSAAAIEALLGYKKQKSLSWTFIHQDFSENTVEQYTEAVSLSASTAEDSEKKREYRDTIDGILLSFQSNGEAGRRLLTRLMEHEEVIIQVYASFHLVVLFNDEAAEKHLTELRHSSDPSGKIAENLLSRLHGE
jgi:hypothetical protein